MMPFSSQLSTVADNNKGMIMRKKAFLIIGCIYHSIFHAAGDSAIIAGKNSIPKTKDLKQIIKELEESDYGGYGSWGNFQARREYRDKRHQQHSSSSTSKNNNPNEYNIVEMDDPQGIINRMNQHQVIQKPLPYAIDYYRSQSSSELALLLEKANILKNPDKKFNLSQIPNLASFVKLSLLAMIVSVLSYLSVSPRNLSLLQYNQAYKNNLLRVGISFLWPIFTLSFIFRHKDADINLVIGSFFNSFVFYYPLLYAFEKYCATIVRILILKYFEPNIFTKFPNVPSIHLSWHLKENKYYPKRLTLFLFLFCNFCITAPIVEEVGKSILLRRLIGHCRRIYERSIKQQEEEEVETANNNSNSSNNNKKDDSNQINNNQQQQNSKQNKLKKKSSPRVSNHPSISVRTVLIYMLAITLGIKTADNTRRILLYTAPSLRHKDFFALTRSLYPVQEICSLLTALNYAKRYAILEELAPSSAVLAAEMAMNNTSQPTGVSTKSPQVKSLNKKNKPLKRRGGGGGVLYRSILLHSMATMRGMKPLSTWDSSRPWDEVQLQAFNAADERSPLQLLAAGTLNLVWFGVLYKYVQIIVTKYFRLSKAYYRKKHDEAFMKLARQRRKEMQQQQQQEAYAAQYNMETQPSQPNQQEWHNNEHVVYDDDSTFIPPPPSTPPPFP